MEELKEFQVTVTETLERVVTVKAESLEDAKTTAECMYYNEEIVLDAEDYVGVEFDAQESNSKIKAIIAMPGMRAETCEIENDLHTFRNIVGGSIDFFYPIYNDRTITGIVLDDGKFTSIPNRAITDSKNRVVDIAFGPMLLISNDGESTSSLSDVQIEKCMKHFKHPQRFYRDENNEIRYREMRNNRNER